MRLISIVAMIVAVHTNVLADDCVPPEVAADNLFPSVKLETSLGDIVVELDRLKAPITVNNFLRYVLDGRYDGTIFHRVEPAFVIQGGGYDSEFTERETFAEIVNESGNGLKNRQWSIAMARFDKPHSASSQFFFNLEDNTNLDPDRGWGYAVFGMVLEGQDILRAMESVETGFNEGLDATAVPLEPIMLNRASLMPAQF